ncbi:unnamed protein product, partial [Ilex paraguariensis]
MGKQIRKQHIKANLSWSKALKASTSVEREEATTPKQVNNPIKETTVSFGKEISSVIIVGDMEKKKFLQDWKKGDHLGKDKIVQHGKYIPPKESVQLIDSENPTA